MPWFSEDPFERHLRRKEFVHRHATVELSRSIREESPIGPSAEYNAFLDAMGHDANLDLICAAAIAWIYLVTGADDGSTASPPCGLECWHLQTPDVASGRNLCWAVLRRDHYICVVFRGTKSAFEWITENAAMNFAEETTEWGTLLAHSGMWNALRNDAPLLGEHLTRAIAGIELPIIAFCGHSKGGGNALAAATCLLVPGLTLGCLHHLPSNGKLKVMTLGSPKLFGQASTALPELRKALASCFSALSWEDEEDPVISIWGPSAGEVWAWYERPSQMLPFWIPVPGSVMDSWFEQHVSQRIAPIRNHATQYTSCLPEVKLLAGTVHHGYTRKTFSRARHHHAHYICQVVSHWWSHLKKGKSEERDWSLWMALAALSLASTYSDSSLGVVKEFFDILSAIGDHQLEAVELLWCTDADVQRTAFKALATFSEDMPEDPVSGSDSEP